MGGLHTKAIQGKPCPAVMHTRVGSSNDPCIPGKADMEIFRAKIYTHGPDTFNTDTTFCLLKANVSVAQDTHSHAG